MAFGKGSFREVLAVAMVLTKQGESKVRDSELYRIVLQKLESCGILQRCVKI